jgi:uncharacterized membrane protein
MRKWLPFLVPVVALGFSAAVYGGLPDRVATHWGIDGRVDGWSSPMVAAFGLPLFMLGLALAFRWLPAIDPRRENYEKFRSTYDTIVLAVIGLVGVIHVAVLGSALGWPISVERVVPIAIGVLFVVMGNLLPRARPNWFVGVRTPWTLSSDRVWERTHRVAGLVFVLCGLAIIGAGLLQSRQAVLLVVASGIIGALFTVVYSYILWRRERPG